jgi:transcriptional regulator with XRE-family HTH domain
MSIVKIDGSKIKSLREQQDLTQLYLATAVGVTTDTISRWENKRYPTIKRENGEKLAEALDVSLEELLEKADAREEQEEAPESTAKPIREHRFPLKKMAVTVLITCLLAGGVVLMLPKKIIQISGKRILPEHAAPNAPFPVIIRIQADTDQELPILIREELTGAGIASGRGTAGEVKDFAKKPRWIGTLNKGQAQFTYMVTPNKSSKEEAAISFSGEIRSRKGKEIDSVIEGQENIRISPYHWADGDEDYIISDNEILIAYETFSSPGESGIDFSTLEELWLAGLYTWNKTKATFETSKTPLSEQ